MLWYGSEELKIRGEPLLIVSEVGGVPGTKKPLYERLQGPRTGVAREGLEPSTSAL